MVRSILKPQPKRPESLRFNPRRSVSSPFPFESQPMASPHVHFPPTPTMVSSTHVADSPYAYDRAPIVVSPNSCAFPERGGRVYASPESVHHAPQTLPKGSYFHPLSFEACEAEPTSPASPTDIPQLIPDTSSSSDESDGYGSPQSTSPIPPRIRSPCHPSFGPGLIASAQSQEEFDYALSFLPYPPSSPAKERPKLKRRKTPVATMKSDTHFREPSLDGCLGGF